MTGQSFRKASRKEALEALQSEGVAHIFKDAGMLDIIPKYVKGLKPANRWMVNDRMFVVIRPQDNGDVEFHPALPKKHWRHIYQDIDTLKEAMKQKGFKRLMTDIEHKYRRTQNLARKCGFAALKTDSEKVTFSWQL